MLSEAGFFRSSLSTFVHSQTPSRTLQEKAQKLQEGVCSKDGFVLRQKYGSCENKSHKATSERGTMFAYRNR